jgi:hypothetical protein
MSLVEDLGARVAENLNKLEAAPGELLELVAAVYAASLALQASCKPALRRSATVMEEAEAISGDLNQALDGTNDGPHRHESVRTMIAGASRFTEKADELQARLLIIHQRAQDLAGLIHDAQQFGLDMPADVNVATTAGETYITQGLGLSRASEVFGPQLHGPEPLRSPEG